MRCTMFTQLGWEKVTRDHRFESVISRSELDVRISRLKIYNHELNTKLCMMLCF